VARRCTRSTTRCVRACFSLQPAPRVFRWTDSPSCTAATATSCSPSRNGEPRLSCPERTHGTTQFVWWKSSLYTVTDGEGAMVLFWRWWVRVGQCFQPFYWNGISCGWSGRLQRCPTGHSFRTYVVIVQKHAHDIFSRVPISLTNCFAEYEQRTLYGALVVILAVLLRLINCRFIIIITIIIINGTGLLDCRVAQQVGVNHRSEQQALPRWQRHITACPEQYSMMDDTHNCQMIIKSAFYFACYDARIRGLLWKVILSLLASLLLTLAV